MAERVCRSSLMRCPWGWATRPQGVCLQARLEERCRPRKGTATAALPFVLKQRSWLRPWDYVTVSSSLALFRTQTQRTETCPHILFLLQMETTLCHQMGLDGKTIKGFKQGVTCCDHTLKAITWLLCRERGGQL